MNKPKYNMKMPDIEMSMQKSGQEYIRIDIATDNQQATIQIWESGSIEMCVSNKEEGIE